MIYTTFAQLYDELMEPKMYDDWLAYAQKKLIKGSKTLDLACGSGRLAVMLAQKGYDVWGFDLSEQMLAIADSHASEAKLNLTLIQGDMSDLSELPVFDNITCFADSFCYLQDEKTLLATLKQVYEHLSDTGVFLFDVITPYQTDKIYPGYMYNYTQEDQAFVWSSFADDLPHSVVHELTFFVWNEQRKAYDRLQEEHHERTYSMETYQKLLAKAGFKNVEITADFGIKQPDEQTTRWFFCCQK
jgi:ubiquinone/menaquinone biosynthesis C-methylase UbiE